MARKPASMRYLADEVPPPAIVLVNALQFVAVISSFLVFPLIVAREAGLSAREADGLVGWSMLALAIGTTLQALPRGPVGSGYLAPSTLTAIFLGPSLHAIHLGGLALMSGMTICAGLMQTVFASGLDRMRRLLPAELAGVIVLLVGISNGIVGLRTLLRPDAGVLPDSPEWIVAGVTLGVMVAANVWSRGLLGMACALVGMAAGYATALALGVLPLERLAEIATLPLLAPPAVSQIGWSFDPTLLLSFAVAAIANGLKAAGLLTATQRAQDADWVRPDIGPICRGVRADGLGVMVSGLFSVFATNISASSVGLIAATGVASRRVAYATSACFALLAFCPMVSRLLMLMPGPILGATLIFTSCAILKGGIEAIAVRMYDTRKTLVVGLSIIAGLGVEAFPRAFALVPDALKPLTVSSLVFGTTVGFLLNLVFRIGQTRREVLRIDPANPDVEAVARFVEARGAQWGARRDVVARAEWAVQELVGTIADGFAERGPLRLSASFDEFNLRLTLRYAGRPFPLVRDRPSHDEIAADVNGAHRLAAYLLGRRTSRITTQSERGGEQVVRLNFDH